MVGVIVGNLRGIAMSTVVTLLVEEDGPGPGERAGRHRVRGVVPDHVGDQRAAGRAGRHVLRAGAGRGRDGGRDRAPDPAAVPERRARPRPTASGAGSTCAAPSRWSPACPGWLALIAFSTINNFLGGVFMALMDPYGLSLVSVETWGLLWGVLSTGFIVGGLVISRRGLGSRPLALAAAGQPGPVDDHRPCSRCARRSCCWPWACSSTSAWCRSSRRPSRPCCRRWCRSSGRAGCSGSRRASSRPPRR